MTGSTPLSQEPGGFLGIGERRFAFLLLFITPGLFVTNILTARLVAETIAPHALALGRWGFALLLLLPFVGASLWREREKIFKEWFDLLVLGALGMWVCGAFVYIAAETTSATNIGLIYGASPVMIVLLARIFWGETLNLRQALGVVGSLSGVVIIICRGDLSVLGELRFAVGDLWIATASFCWAVYSVLLRYRKTSLAPQTRFAAITLGGVIVLLPFTAWELIYLPVPDIDWRAIAVMLLLAVVPGLGAYQAYGRIQRSLGAGPTALLMYLIPLYSAGLAFLILGEALALYHLSGAVLVLSGIYLATAKKG